MEFEFTCRDKRKVKIIVEDDLLRVTVLDERGAEIGAMEFRVIEGPGPSELKLTWAYLDKVEGYKRQGIGRECLRLAAERSGMRITAEEDDGLRKDDGSHLTGDAPGFIAQMREEGIVMRAPGNRDYEDE